MSVAVMLLLIGLFGVWLGMMDAWWDRRNRPTVFVDPDEPRPHGTNPAIFNGPCDCDLCQLWDVMQREQR